MGGATWQMGYSILHFSNKTHNAHTTYCRNKISSMLFQTYKKHKQSTYTHIVTLIDCSLVTQPANPSGASEWISGAEVETTWLQASLACSTQVDSKLIAH